MTKYGCDGHGDDEFRTPRLTMTQIASAPKPRWKQLSHRRLQTWPSDLVNNKLMDAPLPTWLSDPIVPRLKSTRLSRGPDSPDIFSDSPHQKPNHVLINGTCREERAMRFGVSFKSHHTIFSVIAYCAH